MAELALGQGWQCVNGIALLAQAQGLPVLTAPTLQQDLSLSQLEKLWRMPQAFLELCRLAARPSGLGFSSWMFHLVLDQLTWVWSLLMLGTPMECGRQQEWDGTAPSPARNTQGSISRGIFQLNPRLPGGT